MGNVSKTTVSKENAIIAYKAFDKSLSCRGFKYEVGNEYHEDNIELCHRGFHCCKNMLDIPEVSDYSFKVSDTRLCKVKVWGEIQTEKVTFAHDKICASDILILEEVLDIQSAIEDFIREFKDEIDWHSVSWMQKLSEDFIREFKDKVDWHSISRDQTLSEGFIREFKDKVDWHSISRDQNLSEDFIREFKDKVDWSILPCRQYLSEDFIREFKR